MDNKKYNNFKCKVKTSIKSEINTKTNDSPNKLRYKNPYLFKLHTYNIYTSIEIKYIVIYSHNNITYIID